MWVHPGPCVDVSDVRSMCSATHLCVTGVCLLSVQTTTGCDAQLLMTQFSNPITEKVAHAKEENLSMHQMLDQTLLELNNM